MKSIQTKTKDHINYKKHQSSRNQQNTETKTYKSRASIKDCNEVRYRKYKI